MLWDNTVSEIVVYMPTYSPNTEAKTTRHYNRLTQEEIVQRLKTPEARIKPGVYFDAIDSVLNIRPDVHLIVADGRSTDSIRTALISHNEEAKKEHLEAIWHGNSEDRSLYTLKLHPEKMSQWAIFNDLFSTYVTDDTKYFVYTSSDVIWHMDWVAEAIKEFEKNPKLQILFPLVSNGDGNIPFQVASGPLDKDPMEAPYDQYGKAKVLNMFVAIFRTDFLKTYGGYPDIFRNCYTESFLSYLCQAIGGEMKLLPRGHVIHHGTVDLWEENGSFYYFNEEKVLFETIMNHLQMMDGAGFLSVDLLKKTLWRKK